MASYAKYPVNLPSDYVQNWSSTGLASNMKKLSATGPIVLITFCKLCTLFQFGDV